PTLLAARQVDLEELHVAGQAAGADAPDEAPAGQVVERRDAVRQHGRVVVGQVVDAGPQPDARGALQGRRDQDVRRRQLGPQAGEVLGEQRLLVAQRLGADDQVEVDVVRVRG